MSYVIVFLVGALAGFITGALVYRKNKDIADKVIDVVKKD